MALAATWAFWKYFSRLAVNTFTTCLISQAHSQNTTECVVAHCYKVMYSLNLYWVVHDKSGHCTNCRGSETHPDSEFLKCSSPCKTCRYAWWHVIGWPPILTFVYFLDLKGVKGLLANRAISKVKFQNIHIHYMIHYIDPFYPLPRPQSSYHCKK